MGMQPILAQHSAHQKDQNVPSVNVTMTVTESLGVKPLMKRDSDTRIQPLV